MKITFLGATRTVTGSNVLIETKDKKFLLDCGLYQGQQKEIALNTDDFLFKPSEIDFLRKEPDLATQIDFTLLGDLAGLSKEAKEEAAVAVAK